MLSNGYAMSERGLLSFKKPEIPVGYRKMKKGGETGWHGRLSGFLPGCKEKRRVMMQRFRN
jgi:hypothetical protein